MVILHPAAGRHGWGLAAWMVFLQPANDSKWICVDFIDLGVFWGEGVSQPVAAD